MYEKSIRYDRETRDYAMYLDGELVGFARTYHEAEVTLDQLVFELMSAIYVREQPTQVNPTPADPVAAEPASTCCFCHNPHAAQTCPDMRAMLFAPDAPAPTRCATCGGEGDCPDCGTIFVSNSPLDVDFVTVGWEA